MMVYQLQPLNVTPKTFYRPEATATAINTLIECKSVLKISTQQTTSQGFQHLQPNSSIQHFGMQ